MLLTRRFPVWGFGQQKHKEDSSAVRSCEAHMALGCRLLTCWYKFEQLLHEGLRSGTEYSGVLWFKTPTELSKGLAVQSTDVSGILPHCCITSLPVLWWVSCLWFWPDIPPGEYIPDSTFPNKASFTGKFPASSHQEWALVFRARWAVTPPDNLSHTFWLVALSLNASGHHPKAGRCSL